ncbi:MAG: hypothetical protein ACP5R3_06775, partial [Thermoplasmata archaeon]
GTKEYSTNSTITFQEPNGSYTYAIYGISGYMASTYSGTVVVNGNSFIISINWTVIAYPITIKENGIPNGTSWSATITGIAFNGQYVNSTLYSTANTIIYNEPNGSYSYTIGSVSGYKSSPSSGSIVVSGNSVNVNIAFTPLKTTVTKYAVTFTESGLPSGTSWSVTLNGTAESSTNTTITFSEPNGTYHYTISGLSGYRANIYSGKFTITGNTISIYINWTIITYPVTIVESGIPNGTQWSATLTGTT